MEIIIAKGKNRNMLTCKRENGTSTSVNLGPEIPNHDIAHYVVETRFNLRDGFYGKIQSGMTIQELSDKEVIKSLGAETWLSEIMARNSSKRELLLDIAEQGILAKGFADTSIDEIVFETFFTDNREGIGHKVAVPVMHIFFADELLATERDAPNAEIGVDFILRRLVLELSGKDVDFVA